jgi:hypothetical protein
LDKKCRQGYLVYDSDKEHTLLELVKNRLVRVRARACPKILHISAMIGRLNKPGILCQARNAFEDFVDFGRLELLAL